MAAGATRETLLNARAPSEVYRRMLAPLAFLAPEIQKAIAEGRQPVSMKLDQLIHAEIPLAWADQKAVLGF